MTNLTNELIIEQIKQMNEDVGIEVIDNVITVTNSTKELTSYLLLLFGKVIIK